MWTFTSHEFNVKSRGLCFHFFRAFLNVQGLNRPWTTKGFGAGGEAAAGRTSICVATSAIAGGRGKEKITLVSLLSQVLFPTLARTNRAVCKILRHSVSEARKHTSWRASTRRAPAIMLTDENVRAPPSHARGAAR